MIPQSTNVTPNNVLQMIFFRIHSNFSFFNLKEISNSENGWLTCFCKNGKFHKIKVCELFNEDGKENEPKSRKELGIDCDGINCNRRFSWNSTETIFHCEENFDHENGYDLCQNCFKDFDVVCGTI